MKKKCQSMCSLATFVLLLTVGIALNAQQTSPPATSTDRPATPQGQSNQAPDQGQQATPNSPQAQSATPTSDSQTFTGTIVKSGDKYMLQDAASGKSYDIDHQDQVKQYDGKKVRVHGTLDASANMIHVQ